MKRIGILVAITLVTSGCVQPTKPVTAAAFSERVFQRNYTLGLKASAYVGQAVIRLKDYTVRKRQGTHMRPNVNFRVREALGRWLEARSDVDYPVRSELQKEGTTYRAVSIRDTGDGYDAVLVSPDGRPYTKLLVKLSGHDRSVLMAGTAHFEPQDVRFLPGADQVTVDSSTGFTNYELLYGGTDGYSFTLTYREYTPQDLIKPAFTQTLTYENHSVVVRFRNVKLQVHEVTNEHLSYTVDQDDAASP